MYAGGLPYAALCRTYPTSPYIRPILCHPMSDLPYVALCWTYPMLPYVGPTLHQPTLDLPYVALHRTYPTPTYVGPTLHHPTSNLPYVGPTLWCPTPDLSYASDLPYANLHLLNSKFLVRLRVISGHDPLCTFAEPSGA